ncbi:MAG: cytochrome-c peroxidase [Flavipsychrobacter sp.]
MKKLSVLFVVMIVVFAATTAFDDTAKNPVKQIQERQKVRLKNFISAITDLKSTLNAVGSDTNAGIALKAKFLNARAAFKEWEYLGEYLDPQFVKDNINGSPLPKIERNTFGATVAEPKGMQVIDDIIFGDDLIGNRDELEKQINRLLSVLQEYNNQQFVVYDRTVFEAYRMELIRLYTLGLTGFDVPGSGNSVKDAITVLEVMKHDMLLYQTLFEKTDKNVAQRFYKNHADCISYLKSHDDFDKLDRLYVLTQYINPLFADMLLLHRASGVEMLHEVTQRHLLPPFNHMADNLFSNEFLSPFKYVGLPENFYTPALVDLGKTLFYDPVLSSKNNRSCASCHNPSKAFTDGKEKSIALDFDGTVDRNAPTLINCVYTERFFHDMRVEALEDQIEHVLTNRKEFDTDMLAIISKLKDSKEYNKLFEKAMTNYEGEKISSQSIMFALSAYVTSLRGFNSVFDKYVRGEIKTIDPAVRRGYNLFMGKAVCGTCHFAPVFNGTVPPKYEESESEVLGVPENPYIKHPVLDKDLGRAKGRLKENVPFYEYSFKTPTVRNIALTAPYMHNGSYKTLEDILDFYNKGGGDGIGIKLEHQTLPFDSLSLNKQEMADIVKFMKALTDTAGMTSAPKSLPKFQKQTALNARKVGGDY